MTTPRASRRVKARKRRQLIGERADAPEARIPPELLRRLLAAQAPDDRFDPGFVSEPDPAPSAPPPRRKDQP